MRQLKWIGAALVLVLFLFQAPGAQAQAGIIRGEVRDFEGKPYPDIAIRIKSDDLGTTYDLKANRNGQFVQGGLRSGIYTVTFQVEYQGEPMQYEQQVQVRGGEESQMNINFKELVTADAEARAKAAAAARQFEDMKGQFDAGVAALEQAKQLQERVGAAPPDQRPALQQQMGELQQQAIASFRNAESAASAEDPNRHLIMAKLGEAYEAAARFEDAAAAYERAVALRPDQAAYFNNLGNTLARLGRIEDASAAYQKAATLDSANAAMYWLNYGIVLYQSNRMADAVEPLKKTTELNPRNPDGWYLLGAALVAAMEYEQQGDQIKAKILPGTVEAYEKYLDLAPNGRFAAEARSSLEMLAALGAGVQTKYRTPKKRN
jgi:tetratricopeptide (TPR) repeat protein